MKKSMYFLSVLLVLLTACTAPETSNNGIVHLKFGYQPFLSASPLFVGVEGGHFLKQGIELEMIPFTTTADITTAMLSGDIDVSAETLTAASFNAVSQSKGLKYVAERGFIDPNADCSYQVIMARTDLLKDGTLDNPENIKGLKATATPTTIFEYGLEIELAKLGLTPDDIEYIPMNSQPERLEALKNEALDIVTFSEPWVTRTIQSGAADIWVPFGELTPNLPIGVVLYGPKLTADEDLGDRFMLAYLQAIRQYNEGKTDANIASIAKYTELSSDDLKSACWPSVAKDGYTHLDTWLPYQEWLVKKGYMDAVVAAEPLWDDQYLKFANDALK